MDELRELYNKEKERQKKNAEATSFYRGKLAEKSASLVKRYAELMEAAKAIPNEETRKRIAELAPDSIDETKFEDMKYLKEYRDHITALNSYLREEGFKAVGKAE